MNLDARKSAVALSLGMALAACGGSQDGTPDSTSTKALPDETDHSLATKAPADSAPLIRKENGNIQIRGDLLIQALLSQVGQRDDKAQPYQDWLDPESTTSAAVGEGGQEKPLLGPVVLLTEDIQPATPEDSALGKYVYQVSLTQGPMQGAVHDSSTPQRQTHAIDTPSARFGVSLAGLPKSGDAPGAAITTPLEIGRTLQLNFLPSRDIRAESPPLLQKMTLLANAASTIQPGEYYTITGSSSDIWSHTWSVQEADYRKYLNVKIELSVPNLTSTSKFSTCLDFSKAYSDHQRICDDWEVPAGWRSGQPIKHLGQHLRESFYSDVGSSIIYWNWSDKKGTAPIAPDSLKTTTEAVNNNGISGAVLAAMFDAFTPRAKGMQALPARATGTDSLLGTTPVDHKPKYLSLYQESRATTYADGGAADATNHSPATGSYLYAFRSGAWTAPTQSRIPVRGVDQITMALHVHADAQKGFTLPRWTGVNQQGVNFDNKQYWLYQGEQVGRNNEAMTIAPKDLLIFGRDVQTWHDPGQFSSQKEKLAMVSLSIEKSQPDPRTVDMCWTTNVQLAKASKSCTTWQIPQDWQPGQPLKPQAYYVLGYMGDNGKYWSTRVAGN